MLRNYKQEEIEYSSRYFKLFDVWWERVVPDNSVQVARRVKEEDVPAEYISRYNERKNYIN